MDSSSIDYEDAAYRMIERHGEDEKRLVALAQKGDTRAFSTLCEQYRKRVWRVVASVTRGGADTDDLAQEAIVRAFSALRSYRADACFEAWLCRIALNAAHDFQRSAWRRRVTLWDFGTPQREATPNPPSDNGPLSERASCPEGEAERREVQRRVREAVAALAEKERVPIWLIYFEEFTLAEVARLESVPESTVRSRVRAGLKRLERSLGDLNLTIDEEGEPMPTFPASNGYTTAPAATPQWKGYSP